MKIIRCIDVETTSTNEPPDSAICEIGWCDVAMEPSDDGRWTPVVRADRAQAMVINPGIPITPEARAVHHLSDADVSSGASLRDVLPQMIDGADFFAAHSSAYEKKFLADLLGDKPWICTLKAARRVWPDAPAHSLQVLRYWRDLPTVSGAPHRAGPDSYVGALILVDLINSGASVRDMIAWEKVPSLLPGAVRFGKHKGTAWRELPSDYLDWIVNKSDMDEDAKFTASHWLREMVA